MFFPNSLNGTASKATTNKVRGEISDTICPKQPHLGPDMVWGLQVLSEHSTVSFMVNCCFIH